MFLIVGAEGQLGSALREVLGGNAECVGRSALDVADAPAVEAFFSRGKNYAGVINCAAYTAVDKAEDEPALAEKINVAGARNLARACARAGTPLVHVSTDYVFGGNAGARPYTEEDVPAPLSVYGGTKLAGERAVLEEAETALVVRTAWLHSPFGKNFVKTMLRLGAERESLGVVGDQIGTPTYASDLARAIADILPRVPAGTREIYHYANAGTCSWAEFAAAIMELSALPCRVVPIATKDYPTRAPRPAYSVLSTEKIRRDYGLKIPHWRDALARCLRQIRN